MKKALLLPGLFLAFACLWGNTAQQLEEKLQKSAPGLPGFRVFTDFSGIVRTVRTEPSGKNTGHFKLTVLAGHPHIALLEITGVEQADLTGLANFKELKALKIGADKVTSLPTTSLPGVVRLDLSGTQIKDISFLRHFPGVRILQLPETVTDITVLKGRSFRALSIPGVVNSDEVCKSLNIKVSIRTAHAYRRPGRDRLPPVEITRDPKGKVTALLFPRFTPPPSLLKGFAGKLFPEERRAPAVPPVFEEYPALKGVSRKDLLNISLFQKDAGTLRTLDLRALRGAAFNGEVFPELQELYLSGTVKGLHTLKAPKLKKLILENAEGFLPGTVPENFPERYRHSFPLPARENVQKIALAKGWNLSELKVDLFRSEFDFASLQHVQTASLECCYDGRDLSFLKGRKITSLVLDAPFVTGKRTAVLGQLPLKHLNLALNGNADFSFLKKLKLRTLILSGCAGSNFSIALLKKMPLLTLHLRNTFRYGVDLTPLKAPQLRELVLDGITFSRAGFLSAFPKLESLALENCVFAPAGYSLQTPDIDYLCGDRISKAVLMQKKLKNLRIGQIGVFFPGDRLVNYEFPWERFKALKLENFSLCAERSDFAKEFPRLKRLKIDDISRSGIEPLQVKLSKELETLVLTNVRPRPDRPVPEQRFLFRRPRLPAPRAEKGVAKKVYIGGPGGFKGSFLR